jgi:hypothetical protein
MKRLLDYNFEWVLPGHGGRHKLSVEEMKEQLKGLIQSMQS